MAEQDFRKVKVESSILSPGSESGSAVADQGREFETLLPEVK